MGVPEMQLTRPGRAQDSLAVVTETRDYAGPEVVVPRRHPFFPCRDIKNADPAASTDGKALAVRPPSKRIRAVVGGQDLQLLAGRSIQNADRAADRGRQTLTGRTETDRP